MTEGLRTRKRETGATACLARHGGVAMESATGGRMELVTAASAAGFNPVDLLYASLSGCLALSVRIAASELGLFSRFQSVDVTVSGEKSVGEFARIESINAAIRIRGDFTPAERHGIAERAERICTISNTLQQTCRLDVLSE